MNKNCILFILIVSCACSVKNPVDTDPVYRTGSAIELLLDSACVTEYNLLAPSSVVEIYKRNHYQFLWIEADCLKPAADSLINFIRHSAYYGLIANDYHQELFNDILEKDFNSFSSSTIDIWLTDIFFAFHFHLGHGRLHRESFTRIRTLPLDTSAIVSLYSTIQNNSVKASLVKQEPIHDDYHLLKQALAIRLHTFNLLLKNTPFVNVSKSLLLQEIKQISVNMERWRWQRLPLPKRYIKVNIPEFKLYVFNADTIILESKIIVGAKKSPTPVLKSIIECFTIYPYWHVPRKIATRELLPMIQGDTSYIRRNNFDILDRSGGIIDAKNIPWEILNENYFPYVLRQREGEENSLGIIKFLFDNPYAVYLHDTNAKKLFNWKNRALSHGCVRVEKAIGLAHYLVSDDSAYCSQDDLDVYLSLGQRKEIDLVNPIPVYIEYFTYAKSNDIIVLLRDIYAKDYSMIMELYGEEKVDYAASLLSQLGKRFDGSIRDFAS